MSNSGVPAPAACTSSAPPSGSYTLHGLPVDVLPDGKVLVFARARHYDPQLGRWLQRDPLGYIDGPNLYEAFGGNPLVNVDPEGTGDWSTAGSLFGMTPTDIQNLGNATQAVYTNPNVSDPVQALATVAHPTYYSDPNGIERAVLVICVDTNPLRTRDEYLYDFKKELSYTPGAIVLLYFANQDPQTQSLLAYLNPRLGSALNAQAERDFRRGYLQGGANVLQGTQDIGVDLANFALALRYWAVYGPAGSKDDVPCFSSPDWAKNRFLRTSDRTHQASKVMGGQSLVFLVTVGIGGLGEQASSYARSEAFKRPQFGAPAAGGIQFGMAGDIFLTNASRARPVQGMLDVAVHGTPLSVEIGANVVNHRVLARLIEGNPRFAGQPIRLLSCETGALPRGFAQNLANKLGVPVIAPNDIIWAWPNGTLIIGPDAFTNSGLFLRFAPGGNRP